MIVRHVQQPTEFSCGQACLAMLTGEDVEHVMRVIPKKRGTTAKDLIGYLRERGFKTDDRLEQMKHVTVFTTTAILRVTWPNKTSHWVVRHEGQILDPIGIFHRYEDDGGRVTSWLGVIPPEWLA